MQLHAHKKAWLLYTLFSWKNVPGGLGMTKYVFVFDQKIIR